jgi:tetratricopeptide (TPR) repeat protein
MADPPPVRRPPTQPTQPPIPGLPKLPAVPSLPIAPPAALTDVTPATDISSTDDHTGESSIDTLGVLDENTRSLVVPDPGELVARTLELVASEAAALLVGDDPDDRLADLNVRIAFAAADGLHQPDEAMRHLELAERHPLAPRLRAIAAIADPTALAAAQSKLGYPIADGPHTVVPQAAQALAIDVAEAWLFRHREPAIAASIVDRVLAGELPAAWRAHATELGALAHGAANNWRRVVELRKGALDANSQPEAIAAAAALVLDRANDPIAALELCIVALDRVDHTRGGGWLRVLDIACDAASRIGDPRRLELLDRRAELLASVSGAPLELLATRHAVAGELVRDGQLADAAKLYAELGGEPVASHPVAARRIANFAAASIAFAAEDLGTALIAHHNLLESDSHEVVATHAWRALELASVRGDRVDELVKRLVAVDSSPAAARWLDVLDLADPTPTSIERLAARGQLRWAALLAERVATTARALELWRGAAEVSSALGTERDQIVRILRGVPRDQDGTEAGDDDAFAAAYASWANHEADPRAAAALQCARGIVALVRGDFVEAEDTLRRAAELDPKDPFCRIALAAVYRAGKSYDQLARVLADLALSLVSREARAAAAREHAELPDEHLGDKPGARAALERMLDERPDDDEAMMTLARLYDDDQNWTKSIDLRQRAVAAAPTPERRGEIFLEIAQREERRGRFDAALEALEQAAGGEREPEILREQGRIYRKAGKLDRALEVVRAELATDPKPMRRLELRLEEAQLLVELDREPEGQVAAYLDVLEVEPDHADALVGIEAPARKLGLWDELARAFRGARQTPRNLEVLADALEHIAEWSELAQVRRQQLEAAATPAEKAVLAGELARIHDKELGDPAGAVRMLMIAQQHAFDEARQQELVRLLRTAERWADLAQVLERELPTVKQSDHARQLAVLLELGELRVEKLDKKPEAIAAFESALELEPKHGGVLERLETLYEQLGRDRELARLLESRAETITDSHARAQLFDRVAGLRANRGDIDGAIAAYTSAFRAEPSSREVFTAMERVCYKAERWAAAMQLYEIAISHVEAGNSRAYRLGDLFTRRGNVQLNFLGQTDAAIESYQKVIEVDSKPEGAVKVLEGLCRQKNDWAPLIVAWEKRAETQREPVRRAEALRNAAALASDRNADPRASVRLNRKLLSIDPTDSVASAELERYYEDNQDRTGLVDLLKSRLQHARPSETVDILKKIARTSEEGARDVDTATEHYLKILELQPENREALEALSRIYESTEQWAELLDITRKQIKVVTDRAYKALLYFKCGSVMEAKFNREQDAIRYYDAAIKTSPNCLPAVHGLRDLYRRREEWEKVIETLELEVKLWTDDKERAGVFAQIGGIYEKHLDDAERAMQFYDSALAIDSDSLPANQALFEYYFDRGEWDKAAPIAASLAQKAMRDGDPSTRSEFYRKRGVVSRMMTDPKAAADSFVVALEIKPTNAAALDDLGSLARDQPDAWDFEATYRELEKVYKKRDDANHLLARVFVGRASIIERDGELDGAAALYQQALELAPTDLVVLSALVGFHSDMRHWGQAITAIQLFVKNGASPLDRLAALMRQASIHADGEMDATRAIAILRNVIQIEPTHQDAYYELAQQYFLLQRYGDARAAIEKVIELATAPGQALIPEALARYYYYRGRILDAAGDTRAAAPQYRRAIEYDPGYAPPALVLARRAADGGDQRQAETLLIEAAHAAMAQGGPRAAVPLQRGLARILLSSGDRPAAIEAYRGILNVEPDGASDRVALAEIYAVDDPTRAIGELRKVLDRDIHHAPAYRLLSSFYNRTGDTERATRVLTVLDLLGFAEETDRQTMQRLKAVRQSQPLRRSLDDANRDRLLVTSAAREPLGEIWSSLAEQITAFIAQPSLGENLVPAESLGDTRLVQLSAEIGNLFESDADVFVGDKVPGMVAVTAFPRRLIVVDRSLVTETDLPLRYLFGYAHEAIRGGYAALLQLGASARRELAQLLRALVGDVESSGPAAEIIATASPRAIKMLERHAGTRDLDPGAWMDNILACAKRAGLVACDDFAAAIWMVARQSGEQVGSHDDTVALGSVLGGPDLVRFYLSDQYQMIRDLLLLPA